MTRRVRNLIALLEGYAPTQRDWMEVILGAADRFGMCPEDLKNLRRTLESEVCARFKRGDIVRLEDHDQPMRVVRYRDRVVPAEADVAIDHGNGAVEHRTIPADLLLIVEPAARRRV